MKDDHELDALTKVVCTGMKKQSMKTSVDQADIAEALKKKLMIGETLLNGIHEYVIDIGKCRVQLKVTQMDIEEVTKNHPVQTEEGSNYILHYPTDFTRPDGIKRYAFVPELFTYEGYTIAYCEEDDENEEECINLGRKGNTFYKVEAQIGKVSFAREKCKKLRRFAGLVIRVID